MYIKKRRVLNITPYLKAFTQGEPVIVGLSNLQEKVTKLSQLGLVQPYQVGQTILPSGTFGPTSLFNAEGKNIPRKDLPMETAYRQVEWHWEQFNGYNSTIPMSKIADVPYKRYPREFIAPPSIELSIKASATNQLVLVSSEFTNDISNQEAIKHTVNLFLEIFGECELFAKGINSISPSEIKRLNWDLLPRGEMPWEQVKDVLEPLIRKAPKGIQPVLEYRLETINKLNPDFRAVGKGGFNGYIVHGFVSKDLYVLESMYYGNATYIFGESWEELSKKTKADILNNDLQKERIVHLGDWKRKILGLFNDDGEVK